MIWLELLAQLAIHNVVQVASWDQIPSLMTEWDNCHSDINRLEMSYFSDFFFFVLMAGVSPSAATNHRQKHPGRGSLPVFLPDDRHLNGSYWVQHSVTHNLTGLSHRAHSCSDFDKRSHLTSRRCGQLVALYCQDEKVDVGICDRSHVVITWQLTLSKIWRISGDTG